LIEVGSGGRLIKSYELGDPTRRPREYPFGTGERLMIETDGSAGSEWCGTRRRLRYL
jgi:hypothetical protein